MKVLIWSRSGVSSIEIIQDVRMALPSAQIAVVGGPSAGAEGVVDQIAPGASELTPDLCAEYDLVVPGWVPSDWSRASFLSEFEAAAAQDKLWLVPGAGSSDRRGNKSSDWITMVTSSFGYGDYFSVTGHLNRPLVDRLIVVTSIEDEETIRAAQAAGCEVMVTAVETPTRPRFAVIGHKNYFINRALRTVPAEDWVVYVDSDIIVPPAFTEFRQGAFEPGHLYGSGARRLCENEEDVLASYCDSPWIDRLEQCMGIIGYFGFFQRTSVEHQLPEGRPDRDDALEQDDHLFLMSYPSEKRVLTGFQVIHLGSTGVNWRERRSAQFDADSLLGTSHQEILESDRELLRSLLEGVGRGEGVEVKRYPSGCDQRAAVEAVERVQEKQGRSLAIWWEETDLRGVLNWMGELPEDLDEFYVVGKGLDHRFHPKMAAAVRFVFGRPDVVIEEGWWKRLSSEDLMRIREFAALLRPPSGEEPLLVISIPENSSPLQVLPWLESVAPEFVEKAAVFSGDRAADIEMRALELGYRVLTGRYVERQSRVPCEERAREVLATLDIGEAVIVNGRPSGLCSNARLREVMEREGGGISNRNIADFCKSCTQLPREDDLLLFLHRLRLLDEGDEQPVHVVTAPGEDLGEFCLRLATWPLGRKATVYVCTKGDRSLLRRLSKDFEFRIKVRRSRKETVLEELRRTTDQPVLSIPANLLCSRTAFLDRGDDRIERTQPESQSLQRWGWFDPGETRHLVS